MQEVFVSAGNETETLTCGDCYAARPRPQAADEALAWTAHMGPADAQTASPLVALALAPAIYAADKYTEQAEAARRALDEESVNYMKFAKEFDGSSDLNRSQQVCRVDSTSGSESTRTEELEWVRLKLSTSQATVTLPA